MDVLKAEIKFAVPTDEPFVLYPSEGGGPKERLTGQHEHKVVPITNGRNAEPSPALDTNGFMLVRTPSSVEDLYQQPSPEYDDEIRDLVLSLTGAKEVIVFDHTLRADNVDVRTQRKTRQPAFMAHNDYTTRSGPKRVKDLLDSEKAQTVLEGRFAIINVWRPIRGTVRSSPLCLCDGNSLSESDLVYTERRAKERVGELYQVAHNPKQRWYYFPDMVSDEVLIFKCFDSHPGDGPAFAAHTAFEDPTSPPDAPARESIESRTLAVF